MKVLIVGATGFLGGPIAKAYVRAGHEVLGVTRSMEKSTDLLMNEITPVIASSPEDWFMVAQTADLIIDAGHALGPEQFRHNIDVAVRAAKELRRPDHLKLGYIFLSGTWNYGTSNEWKDERGGRFEDDGGLTSWRPAFEEYLMSQSCLHGSVVRPGIVYGTSGGLMTFLFEPAAAAATSPEGNRTWTWPATRGRRWGTVHHDDLAELVLLVGENMPITKHVTFDALNPATESVEDILRAIDSCAGPDVTHKYIDDSTKIQGIYAGFDTHALSKPSLGRAMLGWVPKKKSFVDGMPIWWTAWKASTKSAT